MVLMEVLMMSMVGEIVECGKKTRERKCGNKYFIEEMVDQNLRTGKRRLAR